jgi:hypothetical protein
VDERPDSEGGTPVLRRDVLRYGAAAIGALALRQERSQLQFAPSTEWTVLAHADDFDADVPTSWFDLVLQLIQQTPGFSPPVASRALAYIGVTLFEAIVPGIHGGRSLVGRLTGLADVPSAGNNDAYHWPTVANTAMAAIVRSMFPTMTPENEATVRSVEERLSTSDRRGVPPGVVRRSAERGRSVAHAVFAWSIVDGGHDGFANNFPPYEPPVGPSLWIPTPPGFLPALQPFWGGCRTFVSPSGAACPPPPPTPYSSEAGSRFFADADEVYETVNRLTPEQRAIALFWSDDPVTTPTPPGHSISILTQMLRAAGSSLAEAAEAYAKVGLAVADAFICCWFVKYEFSVLRPVTYIRSFIDASWLPLLITPPFPEFTSGHSVQSGAASTVMTTLLGDVAFTDHTHDARGLPARSFTSVSEAAEEAAISRLYGGIHFRPAIERGLEQGRCIGSHVDALELRG